MNSTSIHHSFSILSPERGRAMSSSFIVRYVVHIFSQIGNGLSRRRAELLLRTQVGKTKGRLRCRPLQPPQFCCCPSFIIILATFRARWQSICSRCSSSFFISCVVRLLVCPLSEYLFRNLWCHCSRPIQSFYCMRCRPMFPRLFKYDQYVLFLFADNP